MTSQWRHPSSKKDIFREVLLDLIGIHFGNCRISIAILMVTMVTWSSLAMSLMSATCRLNDLRKPRIINHDLLNINRKVCAIFAEFRSTIMVAWSSPVMCLMSATCHLFEKRRRESVATAIAISHRASVAIS